MIGGRFKVTSVASIAAAGLFMGGVSAQAADLGGNCCADLEERVAELEATTVRKGNRKVSLEVSGHVHEGILFFDDGGEQNAYIGTPNSSRSRFRFKGSAKINADWSAGFLMEIGVRQNSLASLNQNNPRQGAGLDIRHEALYVKSKSLGTVWLGQTGSAAEGITEINLGGSLESGPDVFHVSFLARQANGALSAFTLNQLGGRQGGLTNGEGNRRDIIRYISPTLAGFVVSAAWGGDDFYDVALRYAGEFGAIRVAGGVGYQRITSNDDADSTLSAACTVQGNSDCDFSLIGASGSIMHTPTGLYLSGAYGVTTDENLAGSQDEDTTAFITAGIKQKFSSMGKTNIYGTYGIYETDGYVADAVAIPTAELTVYGVGIEQDIDAAVMKLYVNYKYIEIDTPAGATQFQDQQQLIIGTRIAF